MNQKDVATKIKMSCSQNIFYVFLLVGFTDPYNHIYSDDESYSKIIRGHKYKDKDNDKDKDTDKVPEKPNICYIFEILMTYSFQIW